MKNKLNNLIDKNIITKQSIKKLSNNSLKALEDDLIVKALEKKHINESDIKNASEFTLEALSYPSIKKCLLKKMRNFNIFYLKFSVKKIFKIKTRKELEELIEKSQKMIKKTPLSIFQVPAFLHDEIHKMKTKLFGF